MAPGSTPGDTLTEADRVLATSESATRLAGRGIALGGASLGSPHQSIVASQTDHWRLLPNASLVGPPLLAKMIDEIFSLAGKIFRIEQVVYFLSRDYYRDTGVEICDSRRSLILKRNALPIRIVTVNESK